MRGSIVKRSQTSWALVVDQGRDPVTRKRKQKWLTFRPTVEHTQKCTDHSCSKYCKAHEQAKAKLAEVLAATDRGEFVEPSKRTVGEWLADWLAKGVKPRRAPSTYRLYRQIIEQHVTPKLGAIRLQALSPLDLERYYAELKAAASTVGLHHAIIGASLKAALRAGFVQRNVATLVEGRPRATQSGDVLASCWEAHEARTFLQAAKADGTQSAAFYTLALDTGARRGELLGLKWTDLDAAAGRLTVQRQLLGAGPEGPVFGPTKTRKPRTIELSAETLARLKTHKSAQAALKLKNRTVYQDHGLIFAREWAQIPNKNHALGGPLAGWANDDMDRLVKVAGVRRVKFHALRHTCATLLLSAGVQANVVQHRLGHANVTMTLGIYGHAIPTMQQDAVGRLAALLHG